MASVWVFYFKKWIIFQLHAVDWLKDAKNIAKIYTVIFYTLTSCEFNQFI